MTLDQIVEQYMQQIAPHTIDRNVLVLVNLLRVLQAEAADEIESLQKQLAAAKEDAECAWRNVRTLEAARQEEMKKRDAAEKKEPCNWTQDGYGEDAWDTGCNNRFMLEEGAPSDNGMKFCCFCGHPIDELPGEEIQG